MGSLNVVLCTQNAHKLGEFRALFPDWLLDGLDAVEYPVEDGDTYLDNARIKARFGRELAPPEAWVLADDSGIELDVLEGGPGVLTARWAGEEHVARALAAVAGASTRRARYVCELLLLAPDRRELRGTGVLAGQIAEHPAGSGGFGFDPVFVPHGYTETVAQLGDDWKREHSHRAVAARALRDALRTA
jgi:XTP/dITP diphosphohydrolase